MALLPVVVDTRPTSTLKGTGLRKSRRLARSVRRNTRHVRDRSKRHLSCSGRNFRSDALGAHEKRLLSGAFLGLTLGMILNRAGRFLL